ncbi:hypothetical protein GCM10008955_17670 [Deinococcus malanensis]|uniref:Exo-alpha-sialidase n=1 Tax=Deinococcus malanensis TaxID=1706855 RepID=A0ABQ2ETW8_9DEIO|nr:hypothetical protein GCM10008955_17670 [Deinococcus malanensis]
MSAEDSRGGVVWTRAFPKALVADTGRVRQNVLVLTETGNPQFGTQQVVITLLSGATGQTLWERNIYGRLHAWGMADDALWVTRNDGGVNMSLDNFGFRLRDGRPLWETTSTSSPQATAKGSVLFRRPTKAGAPNDPVHLEFQVMNTSTGQSRLLKLKISERPQCRPLDDTLVMENFATKADERFYWAQRHDRCGYFVTRFDWHESERQRPVVRVGILP